MPILPHEIPPVVTRIMNMNYDDIITINYDWVLYHWSYPPVVNLGSQYVYHDPSEYEMELSIFIWRFPEIGVTPNHPF